MAAALIGLNALTVIAFVWLIRDLVAKHDARERSLLNRIQAPESAVARAIAEDTPVSTEPAFLAIDNDDAYWKYKEQA